MLITMKDGDGNLTPDGALLKAAGLGFLPDQFNVDDGVVGKAEQDAILAHPSLDNVAWRGFGVIAAAKAYAADHPIFSAILADKKPIGPDHPLAAASYERLHGVPQPSYTDASDPEGAKKERVADAAKKAAKLNAAAKPLAIDEPHQANELHRCSICGTEWVTAKDGPVTCPEAESHPAPQAPQVAPASEAPVPEVPAQAETPAPSAEDLDAVAEEEAVKDATKPTIQ